MNAVFICLVLSSACQHESKSTVSATDIRDNKTDIDFQQDTIPDPHRFQFIFGDSVNRAFFWDQESTLRETGSEALRMDGRSVLYIEKASLPFGLRTALMDIEVLELPLLLQVDAFDNEAGQSLELFSGALKVEKSYESSFPSLDTLRAGDLYMINKDIDLSEKEHLDDFSIQHWWETYSQ
ncbi:hypothetical protein [Parapedobacter defluvii]|uniref:hypothetical protein n=1 Tax=Parapedobacter defluvii TaxID=2045106 RepID=UPI0016632C59|nr:hypothetical protein [Parapedobacter defluvii]